MKGHLTRHLGILLKIHFSGFCCFRGLCFNSPSGWWQCLPARVFGAESYKREHKAFLLTAHDGFRVTPVALPNQCIALFCSEHLSSPLSEAGPLPFICSSGGTWPLASVGPAPEHPIRLSIQVFTPPCWWWKGRTCWTAEHLEETWLKSLLYAEVASSLAFSGSGTSLFLSFCLLTPPLSILACMPAQSLSHVQLCDPMDCRPPGSSVPGISQAWILEWVAISFSSGSSQPRSPELAGRFFYHWATWEAPSNKFPSRFRLLGLDSVA